MRVWTNALEGLKEGKPIELIKAKWRMTFESEKELIDEVNNGAP